jgi:hypothetical protein
MYPTFLAPSRLAGQILREGKFRSGEACIREGAQRWVPSLKLLWSLVIHNAINHHVYNPPVITIFIGGYRPYMYIYIYYKPFPVMGAYDIVYPHYREDIHTRTQTAWYKDHQCKKHMQQLQTYTNMIKPSPFFQGCRVRTCGECMSVDDIPFAFVWFHLSWSWKITNGISMIQ